jgi:hypothetical protein
MIVTKGVLSSVIFRFATTCGARIKNKGVSQGQLIFKLEDQSEDSAV